ncbi:MAG: ATP-dependent DNA helicase RecG, partial [Taibaiella sp.]|nr:ATP-dependent DNA helicase RecG [Taibaiella sp.]
GHAPILVSTTVIEVGVNVPNASIMIIESAERFGLSQLHQLRGRVGRGAEHSYCILLTSGKMSNESRQRMKIMEHTQDGFKIAEEDLRMRGPGDIFGTKQSGSAVDFKLADIINDIELIAVTRDMAKEILSRDPDLQNPLNQPLRRLLVFYTDKATGLKWDRIS